MNILIIDKDPHAAQFIKPKIEPLGHKVTHEASKNAAVKLCQEQEFDLIFLDPSPLTSPRTLIHDIKRTTPYYSYSVLMSENQLTRSDGLKFGVNEVFKKPMDPTALDGIIDNAQYFINLVKRMSDDSEDFPSAGGVIAKSAYNQLFRSAIDRADRYGEETYVLFISLNSYSEIASTEGPYAADYAVAKLSQHLVGLRRQSDIIGQTASNEYSLLLQRPVYETEPVDAANRFTEALMNYDGFKNLDTKNIQIRVRLACVPSGERPVDNVFDPLKGQV